MASTYSPRHFHVRNLNPAFRDSLRSPWGQERVKPREANRVLHSTFESPFSCHPVTREKWLEEKIGDTLLIICSNLFHFLGEKIVTMQPGFAYRVMRSVRTQEGQQHLRGPEPRSVASSELPSLAQPTAVTSAQSLLPTPHPQIWWWKNKTKHKPKQHNDLDSKPDAPTLNRPL